MNYLKNSSFRTVKIASFALLAFVFSGCASQKEFNSLKTEVDAIKVKSSKIEKDIGVLGNDKNQALRNQASIQNQFSELQTQLRELQGKIEELSSGPKTGQADIEKRLKTLEDMMKGQSPAASSKGQYEAAMEKLKAGKNLEALKAFDAYIAANPNGDLIDNANFWAGECLYAEGNYESAIDRYDIVLKNFPKSPKIPDAMYKEGLALKQLGDAEASGLLLKKVINEYPDSEAAKKARAQIGEKPASAKKGKKKH